MCIIFKEHADHKYTKKDTFVRTRTLFVIDPVETDIFVPCVHVSRAVLKHGDKFNGDFPNQISGHFSSIEAQASHWSTYLYIVCFGSW